MPLLAASCLLLAARPSRVRYSHCGQSAGCLTSQGVGQMGRLRKAQKSHPRLPRWLPLCLPLSPWPSACQLTPPLPVALSLPTHPAAARSSPAPAGGGAASHPKTWPACGSPPGAASCRSSMRRPAAISGALASSRDGCRGIWRCCQRQALGPLGVSLAEVGQDAAVCAHVLRGGRARRRGARCAGRRGATGWQGFTQLLHSTTWAQEEYESGAHPLPSPLPSYLPVQLPGPQPWCCAAWPAPAAPGTAQTWPRGSAGCSRGPPEGTEDCVGGGCVSWNVEALAWHGEGRECPVRPDAGWHAGSLS